MRETVLDLPGKPVVSGMRAVKARPAHASGRKSVKTDNPQRMRTAERNHPRR